MTKPPNFEDYLPDEIREWLQVGLHSMCDAREEETPSAMLAFMKYVHADGEKLVIVDQEDTVHMFRIKIERL